MINVKGCAADLICKENTQQYHFRGIDFFIVYYYFFIPVKKQLLLGAPLAKYHFLFACHPFSLHFHLPFNTTKHYP